LPVCTRCHTGLIAASAHVLASIDNARYFEGGGSTDNPLRSRLCSASCELCPEGWVSPLAGLGLTVDEEFLRAYPVTKGPAWR
jgi:D-galactarolactone cycloisomerase